ncbi:hypothetical protein ACIRLA_46270 [Streptomyces sp. NPDC102364]|uniref:hypothetical protein n=1 Tax=Streptomyces sp. NPDC102364 TaxID=3366161 RepID=UPI0038242D3A
MPVPHPHTEDYRNYALDVAQAPPSVARAMTDAMLARGVLHSWRVIAEAARDSVRLHRALSLVWDEFADGPERLAEAQRDADRAAAVVEYEQRAHAAGARNRAAPCVCGHSGSVKHAATLAEGDRLPCTADGCRCDDADYATP